MKITLHLITALMALFCLTSCKTPEDVETGPFTISVIEKNVYHIQDYNSSYPAGEVIDTEGKTTHFNNCSDIYLIVGGTKALLIDLSNRIRWAENAEESLRQLVAERIEGKELTITFTHNHGDHIGMLKAYIDDPSVHFALPEADFSRLAQRFPEAQSEFFNEGRIFDLGGMKVEAIAVPGHTDGSMVFYLHGKDLLFTGDAIGSGHGVWIFNADGFHKYASAIPHLISWINNPENGVNVNKLRIYGGHYWQRDWLPELEGKELGMSYINEMQELINQIKAGTASKKPSGLGRADLDTYFRNGSAIITWNAAQAEAYGK